MQAQILTFIIPGIMAIFAAVLFALWWTDRSRIHVLAFGYWAFAFCLGIILQGAVPWNFAPYDILLFHWNATFAVIAMIWGVAKRDRQRSPVAAMLLLTAMVTPILYFARSYEQQSVLLMVQNFNMGILFALAAQAKWRVAPRNIGDRALLWTFVVLAGYAVMRPCMTILSQSQMTMAEYQASAFGSLNVVLSSLLALMLALSLIAMVVLDNMRRDREFAVSDPLTGLHTRSAFEREIRVMLAKAVPDGKPVSLIVCDIDHFKRVNDTFGHAAGDRVIARFGEIVTGKIRGTDVAGRVGGEEFCVAVWDCPEEPAARLADRIRLAAASSTQRGSDPHEPFTVSFGVAEIRHGEGYKTLFDRADRALYEAKDSGRNRVVIDGAVPAEDTPPGADTARDIQGAQVVSLAKRKAG
ncbi:MAG: GGDEF domain-containing protein [Erythrobacter sp.]